MGWFRPRVSAPRLETPRHHHTAAPGSPSSAWPGLSTPPRPDRSRSLRPTVPHPTVQPSAPGTRCQPDGHRRCPCRPDGCRHLAWGIARMCYTTSCRRRGLRTGRSGRAGYRSGTPSPPPIPAPHECTGATAGRSPPTCARSERGSPARRRSPPPRPVSSRCAGRRTRRARYPFTAVCQWAGRMPGAAWDWPVPSAG